MAALPVIRSCGIDTPVIGLAKRMEEIYVEGQTDPIIIDPHEPALQLLQFIRDEAHRFVIAYHRKWTSKRNTESYWIILRESDHSVEMHCGMLSVRLMKCGMRQWRNLPV